MDNLWNVLIAPRKVCDSIREDPSVLMPLATIMVLGCILAGATYYLIPDQHYIDSVNAQIATAEAMAGSDNRIMAEVAAEQLETLEASLVDLSGTRMVATFAGAFSTPLGALIGLLIYATYLLIVAKIVKSDISWVNWFAFASWVSLPLVVGYLAMLIFQTAFSGLGLGFGLELAPLAWLGMDAGWALALTIPPIWIAVLTFYGLESWLQKGTATSAIAAAIPFVVSYLLGATAASVQNWVPF